MIKLTKEEKAEVMSRVRSQLKVRGWSIATFAEKSKISNNSLVSYFAGRHEPGHQAMVAMAQTLECTLDYLFMPEPSPEQTQKAEIARDKSYLAGKLNVTPDCITIELLDELLATKVLGAGMRQVANKLKAVL